MARGVTRVSAPVLLGAVLLGATIPVTAPYLTTVIAGGGRVYYVSATRGNDAYGGSFTAPFGTISKCAAVVRPGQTCSVEGGTYREMVTPLANGTALAPITYTVSGSDPVTVTGADLLGGPWRELGTSAIYTAPVTLPVPLAADSGFLANQVFVDGVMMPLARAPNVTTFDPLSGIAQLIADGSSTTSLLHNTSIPAIPWTQGGIAHYWGYAQWIARTSTITSTATSQVGFAVPLAGCPNLCAANGTPFYLEGAPAALDAPGEWVYTDTTHTLALYPPASDSPLSHTVEAKQRTWAFDLSGKSYITVQGFHLFAASITTTQFSSYDTIDAITATYLSHFITIPEDSTHLPYTGHRDDTGIVISGTHNTLENSILTYSAGNGVTLSGRYNTATNNLVQDMDYSGSYGSLIDVIGANNANVTHNTLHDTARDGIHAGTITSAAFTGNLIAYNDIYNFGLHNDDLGGFYICCGIDGSASTLAYNWFHDNKAPVNPLARQGAGIYLDNGTGLFLLHHNVLWNNAEWGIHLNNAINGNPYNVARGNTNVYNNTMAGGQTNSLAQEGSADASIFRNNIFGTTLSLAGSQGNKLPNIEGSVAYLDALHGDFRLAPGSAAIDAGTTVAGITDGYVGTAPDAGAYEFAAPLLDWIPGCTMTACADPYVPNRHAVAP